MCAVCGEGDVTDWMCQKWFAKFRAGDFSLDDAPWSGRRVEVDSDQIETIENHQRYPTWEIPSMLKISKLIVIGENEKCLLLYREKHMDFVANPILNIMSSRFIHIVANGRISFLFKAELISHCMYRSHFLWPVICQWTFRLLSCLSYCK